MNTITSKIITIGGLLILVIISGVILSKLGRPLNTLVFTIHKLSAVGAIVLLVININKLAKAANIPTLHIALIVITGLFFLALIVSGAFLSFEKPAPQIVLRIHQVLPLLVVASSAISFYLLIGGEALSRTGVMR
jgi:hypothetical protein